MEFKISLSISYIVTSIIHYLPNSIFIIVINTYTTTFIEYIISIPSFTINQFRQITNLFGIKTSHNLHNRLNFNT